MTQVELSSGGGGGGGVPLLRNKAAALEAIQNRAEVFHEE